MAIDITQNLRDKFNHATMQELMGYLSTRNCESQVVAMHVTSEENVKSTGTKAMMINGQVETCEADPEIDISADTTGTETAWALALEATVGMIRANKDAMRFRCVVAHTATADDEPLYAINASGDVLGDDEERWYMVTAQADGTLTVWLAGDVAALTLARIKVPQYDYKVYCPVAFMHVKNEMGGADFTLGTTDLDDATGDSVTATILQVTYPVFPHPDNWVA